MAYYIAVETNPNYYEIINIKKTTTGKRLFDNDSYACTLEEIDSFTSEYRDLKQLIYDLYSEKKVQWWSSSIAIVREDASKITIISDFLFLNSKKYLLNPDSIREYIVNTYLQTDITFFEEVLTIAEEDNETKKMITKVIQNIEMNLIADDKLDILDIEALTDALLYTCDQKGKKILPQQYDYCKIRRIALCIANYEQQKIKNDIDANKKTKIKNT